MKKYLLLLLMALPLCFTSCSDDDDEVSKTSLEGTTWTMPENDIFYKSQLVFDKTTVQLLTYTEDGIEKESGSYTYDYPVVKIKIDGLSETLSVSGNEMTGMDDEGDKVVFILD